MESMDSDYLQRQLKILADDMKDDDPDVAKAYLFIQHRLNQSFPDGDVSREEIKDILNEPQGRKHSQNMPDWALDQLFENRARKKKTIKESKLSSLIDRIIKEEVRRIRLKESPFEQITGSKLDFKKYGIKNHSDLKQLLDWLRGQDIPWNQVGQSLKFNSTEDLKKVINWLNDTMDEIKESSSQEEIEDIAVDLIDYLGKELPTVNWNKNPRIMGFFREQGLTDANVIKQIYQTALKLNAE